MFRNKLKLFAISLTAVWIVLFIKNVDIPVYFGGDSQFVGWARLLTYRNLIALFSVVMMAVSIHSIIQLRHRLKGSPSGLTVTLTVVKDKNYDLQINYQKFYELCTEEEKKKLDEIIKKGGN